jgi:hypothetical protein
MLSELEKPCVFDATGALASMARSDLAGINATTRDGSGVASVAARSEKSNSPAVVRTTTGKTTKAMRSETVVTADWALLSALR